MKKITFYVFALLAFTFTWNASSQIVNQDANWPNAAWTTSGTFTPAGLISEPATAATFSFDDDAAGNGSVDNIASESPVIDLTAASGGGETDISVSGTYVFRTFGGVDFLKIQYWDFDGTAWVDMEVFTPNSTNLDYQTCVGTAVYITSLLDISAFTPTQLSGFKYRVSYDDGGSWEYGYCLTSPTITSSVPLTCTSPTATTTVVDACISSTYTVDVTVDTLGDATTVSISNDGGVATTANVGLGTYSIGPFTVDQVVSITLEHDQDNACNVVIGSFESIACPPECPTTPSPADTATDVIVNGDEVIIDFAIATGGAPADSYEIFFGDSSPPPSIGNASGPGPYTITGIAISTEYFWQIVPSNGGVDATGPCDIWSFTTEGPPPPSVPPYLNDFSVFPGSGWTEAGSGDPTTGPMTLGSGDWISDDYGNVVGGPNGLSARINLWQNVDQEWLISTEIDLTAAGPFFLNLDVALTPFTGSAPTSFGSDDEVQVLITSDGGTTWVNLLTYNLANQPGTSREAAPEVDLSSYAGNIIQIAIWATDGAVSDAEDNNFYVDNFQVTTSSLNTADLLFEGFKYFPNPVEGTLSLRAKDNIQNVTVYNMLGQEVLSSTPNSLEDEMDMSPLQTGAYFVKVRINDVEGNFRIIKE